MSKRSTVNEFSDAVKTDRRPHCPQQKGCEYRVADPCRSISMTWLCKEEV